MKKFLLIPAIAMFAAAPALAQSPSGSTPQNSRMGLDQTTKEGAEASSMGTGHNGHTGHTSKPSAPSQIENSSSDRTGATPTDENRDNIKHPQGQ
jgi:hypothetical protein